MPPLQGDHELVICAWVPIRRGKGKVVAVLNQVLRREEVLG